MMKKMFAVLLSLCLLCGACALAENTGDANGSTDDTVSTTLTNNSMDSTAATTVTYTVESSYTVMIPSAVSIPSGAKSAELTVTLKGGAIFAADKLLYVYLDDSANGFYLKSETNDTIPYRVVKSSGSTAKEGDWICRNSAAFLKAGDNSITLTLTLGTATAPGVYSDSLTFRVALEDATNEGWTLNQVTASSAAGVTISGNRIILADVYEDKTLTIRFGRVPEPTPTNTPVLTATNTLEPAPTNTSEPTAKPTATASQTPKATAGATASPTPAVTVKPTTVPVESQDNVLYDGYLGTGEGLGQLFIVFDEEYAPKDYELLPVVKGNELLICARPDEAGQTVRRSLILSAHQLQRLQEDCELGALLFRNGSMTALADMAELYTGRMAKLMALGYEQGWENISLDEIDWKELPEAELTAAQLSEARIEACVIPELTEDEREGYAVQVFLRRATHCLR